MIVFSDSSCSTWAFPFNITSSFPIALVYLATRQHKVDNSITATSLLYPALPQGGEGLRFLNTKFVATRPHDHEIKQIRGAVLMDTNPAETTKKGDSGASVFVQALISEKDKLKSP